MRIFPPFFFFNIIAAARHTDLVNRFKEHMYMYRMRKDENRY